MLMTHHEGQEGWVGGMHGQACSTAASGPRAVGVHPHLTCAHHDTVTELVGHLQRDNNANSIHTHRRANATLRCAALNDCPSRHAAGPLKLAGLSTAAAPAPSTIAHSAPSAHTRQKTRPPAQGGARNPRQLHRLHSACTRAQPAHTLMVARQPARTHLDDAGLVRCQQRRRSAKGEDGRVHGNTRVLDLQDGCAGRGVRAHTHTPTYGLCTHPSRGPGPACERFSSNAQRGPVACSYS